MYMNGTHQDTNKIQSGYITIHQDTYPIGNYTQKRSETHRHPGACSPKSMNGIRYIGSEQFSEDHRTRIQGAEPTEPYGGFEFRVQRGGASGRSVNFHRSSHGKRTKPCNLRPARLEKLCVASDTTCLGLGHERLGLFGRGLFGRKRQRQ